MTYSLQCYYSWTNYSAPQNAIVTNFGSNNVSIINLSSLSSPSVTATIPVGSQPVAVLISPDQTKAFVANYGSGTITEINLSNNTVIAALAVGSSPATLTMDPGGQNFWVAGYGYISEVSLSTFSVVSTTSISGQVTALAISAAQNKWVYTTVSSDLSSFKTQDAAITTGTPTVYTENTMSTAYTDYVIVSPWTNAPPSYLKSSVIISSNFGNGVAVTSTPTGFAALDLVNHKTLMQSSTSSPVRGIATDPTQGVAYLTEPESNTLLTVPVPQPDPN